MTRPPSPASFPPTAVRLLLAGVAAALVVWGGVDPRFRDAEGLFTGRICLPLGVAAAAAVMAIGAGGPSARASSWLALAIAGQAAALQLIDAGPSVRHQHYAPLERWASAETAVPAALLLIQAVVVIAGLWRRRSELARWARATSGAWVWGAALVVVAASGAAPSREVWRYPVELLIAAVVQWVSLGNIVLVVATSQGWSPFNILGRLRTVPTALAVTIAAAVLAVWSYERHPHVPDEVAYLIHARYFADLRLSLPAPPSADAFFMELFYYEPHRFFSPVPPGWPAILAAGVWLGAPWLVNPLLGGVNVVLAYALTREFTDRETARAASALLALSPWHLFLAMSFMTHTATLTAALAAALGVARAGRTARVAPAVGAGLAIGVASLIRPLDGLIVAALVGLPAIAIGGRRLRVVPFAALVASTVAVAALVFPYNAHLTGGATWFPIMAYNDRYFGPNSNALGFGPDRGGTMNWPLDPGPGHGVRDATINTALNAHSLNTELFGWSCGSLILAAWLLFSGTMRRPDWLLAAAAALLPAVHFFYWYSGGPDFGARYWILALLPCVLLTVRAMQVLDRRLHAAAPGVATATERATLAAACLALSAVLTFVPWRAIDKYHHFRGMRPDIRHLAAERGWGRSLVLVRGIEHPDFVSAAVYNPVDLRSDETVYAWDRGPGSRAELLRVYADRPVWIVDGPARTGRGFEVVAGPLPASEALGGQ